MLNLNNVMRLNATSCLVFGGLFVLVPSQTAHFLGGASPAPSMLITALGIALIVNGLHLIWASTLQKPQKELVWYFSGGDFIWAIASIGLVLFNLWITTPTGIATSILIAIMVGFFGVMQLTKRQDIENG